MAEIDEEIRTEMDVAIVPYDEEFANDNDDVSVASDGNDMSTLQHQIAILEAQLRQTRSYNERTLDEIEALDNLEDIDSMIITFDQDDENIKGGGQNFAHDETPRDNPRCIRTAGTPSRPPSAIDSLYHRQEKWASSVEKRLEDARLKRADDIMSGFTGKPQIASTGDSWQRAKAAHDAVVRQVSEEQEHEEVHRGLHEKKKEETADSPSSKLEEATNAIKSNTRPVDRKRQADYAERLARPRSIAVPSTSVPKEKGGDADETDTKNKLMQKSPFLFSNGGKQIVKTCRQTPTIDDLLTNADTSTSNGAGRNHAALNVSNNNKSFAEMNDKEFANIMRRLGIKSIPKTKGEKKTKKPCATTISFATLDNETASKLPLEAYLGSSPKSNGKRPPRSPPTGGGRFVSSEAQANLFKKITDQEREAVANKIRGPSKSAGSAFSNDGRSVSIERSKGSKADLNVASSWSGTCNTEIDESPSPRASGPTKVQQMEQLLSFKEPYQRYEAGQAPFFDKSSSDERGRFRVRDASSFDPTSMRRIVGPDSDTDNGVMLLVGEKYDENGYRRKEYAITILFDRRKWKEEGAERWWGTQRHRFVGDS